MRAIAILIILAVLGFFGYQYAVEGRDPMQAIGVLTGETQAAEAAAAQAAAEAEAQAAAAAAAQAAAEAQAQAAAEAAAAEAAAAQAAAEEAAAQAAAEAEAAAAAAAAELEAAADAATEAATEAGADVMAAASELLTVEGFDMDQVMTLLEGADISELQKTTLGNALTAAQDNPELLQPVLQSIQAALGLQ